MIRTIAHRLATSALAWAVLGGCDSDNGLDEGQDMASGGVPFSGGAPGSGGVESGGTPSGGAAASGGAGSGGLMATGGAVGGETGGGASAGGNPTGGTDGAIGGSGGESSASGGALLGSGGTDSGMVVPVGATPDERHFLVRDEGHSQVHYIDLGDTAQNWTVDVPVGRELQLVGAGRFLIGTESGYEERSVVDGSVQDTLASYAGTVAARRLRNGHTLLVGADWQGVSGVALLEVDDAGAEVDRVVYADHHYARLVRPTSADTYLVTADRTIFEGDKSGNILWQVQVQDSTEPHAWKALRLSTGQTVVATGYEASLQFFSATEQFEGRLKGPAETTPNFYCDFQLLPSGNYLVTNWQGHGEGLGDMGHQLVELTPSGEKAWSWQQDASYVSSLQAAILLDGLDLARLHVEDTTGELVPVE